MPKKPTYGELQRPVAELESQQQLLTEIANRKRAEEALRQSEARLNHALEIADVGCWEWDIKTGTLLWSEQTYRQMGEQPGQCSPSRNNFLQYVHPEDRAAFATAMDQTLAGSSCFDLEFRIVRPDGGIRILHSRGEVVRSPDGPPLRMFGVSTDITERKRAEEELRERERLLQTVIDGSTSPIFLKGLDGKFITINAALERMLGISREEIKGKTDYDIASMEVADYWRSHDKQVIATCKAIQIEEVADLPDGHHIFLANKFPLVDVDGQIYGVAAISHDVTERKRAEEAVQRHAVVLAGINRILEMVLRQHTEEELCEACQDVAEGITGSRISFIGEVGLDGLLHDLAIRNPGWNACMIHDQTGRRRPPGSFPINRIYGRVLVDGKSLIVNDPSSHPDRFGLPIGHAPLMSFLGVPLQREGKTVGMIAVGNREGGYRIEDQQALEAFAPAVIEAVHRKRAEEETIRLSSFPILNPIPIIEADMDGKVLFSNPSAQSLFPDLKERGAEHPFVADCGIVRNGLSSDAGSAQREVLVGGRWYLQSVNFIKEVQRLRIYGVDITERKRSEQRLAADLEALTRMHALSTRVLDAEGTQPLMQEIMDAAVAIVGADKGTLQLLEGGTLRIVAHQGHERTFLDFFAAAENVASVCGEATRRGERIVVPDVEYSPIFAGTPSLSVLREAGVRAVQSTPLRTRSGRLLGILTTHWSEPHAPDEHNLWRLDLLARQAADLIEQKSADEALRVEQNRLTAILENMPEEVWFADKDMRVTLVNRAVTKGFDENMDVGQEIEKIAAQFEIYRADGTPRPPEEAPLLRALRGGVVRDEEEIIRTPASGELRYRLVTASPVRDSQGSVIASISVIRDITERKRAEESLRDSAVRLKAAEAIQEERQRLYRVLETLPAMVCLLTPDHHVAFANRGFRERFGESEGRHCYEFCYGRSQPCEFCESYNVLKTGKPHHWEVRGGEGSIIDAYDFPFTDVDGSPLILEMDVDITEQRRAEAALRESGAYNRTLIEASPDPLVTIGPDGRITDVNGATEHATGRNRRELVGTDFSEYFSEPDKAQAGYQQVFREGAVRNYSLEIRHRDGHTTPVLYNATVYRNAEGKVVGVFAAARDITDRRQAEQELRRAHEDLALRASQLRVLAGELTLSEQRERSRLAKVLHDHLQQLLVAAKFRLTILGRTGDDILKQATKEVEELIDESISSSRSLTAELSPPILHDAGLNAGLEWLARRMADKHGLFVDLEMEEHESLSEQLTILLFESVRELLFNVVKHARTGSANVNLRHVDSHLQVTVSDQGEGFDPTTVVAGEEGHGFGLFAIRERLEFMGGTLQIKSTPGQGSRFVLFVPIALTEKIGPQSQKIVVLPEAHLTSSGYPDPGRNIRIMLVDDHAIVRQGMANLLGDEPDMEVVGQAADGQEAVDLAARLLPDVILMDMSMPKLNGVEATRIIHNDWPDIRIIGLSMFEEADRAQAMRDAGAVDYVTKTGPAEALINLIRTSVRTSNKGLSFSLGTNVSKK